MILPLFFALIQSQIKICVCNKNCSSLCQSNSFNAASNSKFEDFILPYINTDKEIELDLYSKDYEFIFELDLSFFKETSINLKNLNSSKAVNVIIKNSNSFVDKIYINPGNQVQLPKFYISNQTTNKVAQNKNPILLDDASEIPIREYDDLKGLINVTCDRFNYIKGCGYCHKGYSANGGSFINNDEKLNFRFNGTRIYVVSFDQNNPKAGGNVNISIDGKFQKRVSISSKTGTFKVVYTSEYLPYGEHLIEFTGVSNNGETFYLNSLLVDPRPEVGGHLLDFNDIRGNNNWTLVNSTKTPYFWATSIGASFTFKFHGTRFWLTGTRNQNYGKCNLTIDDGENIIIDGQTGIDNFNCKDENEAYYDCKYRAYGNQGVLLYESDVLDFKDHTISITKIDDKEFRIINLLYSTQPYNAIVVPPNEISFDSSWTQHEGGYITNHNGGIASVTEYFDHFWIVGNKTDNPGHMKVSYGDDYEREVDINAVDTIFSDEILFTSINYFDRGTRSIEVEKTGAETESLHISYFYYLNEKTINVHKNAKEFNTNSINSQPDGWTNVNDSLCSDTEGSSIEFNSVRLNQFWISGIADPNYGIIDIYVDDVILSSVSLYHEKHEENIVFYESPIYQSMAEHKVKIVNHNSKRVCFSKMQYYAQEYDYLEGLINVTCDRFNPIDEVGYCHKSEEAQGGSFLNKGGKLIYKFNGTRIYVVSFDQDNKNSGGEVNISIDGKVRGSSKLTSRTSTYPVVFVSDYLPFGEHLIEIEHTKSNDRTFYVNSFLVDPLPKVGGHVLGYNDIENKDGWEFVGSAKTPYFRSSENGVSFTFKFHGTRFWLTGIRHPDYGNCSLVIDNKIFVTIDERTGVDEFHCVDKDKNERDCPERAANNQGFLLYESDVLDFMDHTISIAKIDDKEFRIINLLYSTQPYNAIVVPSYQISFNSQWKLHKSGYSTSAKKARASFWEYLNNIWVIGNKFHDQAGMNVYLNENTQNFTDIGANSEFNDEILFKSINNISRDTYLAQVGKHRTGTSSLNISYFYYLNEKTINVDDESNKISSAEMFNGNYKKEGAWELKDSSIYTEQKGASIEVEFFGNKFWIYGDIDPNFGKIDVFLDGEKQSSVSFYNEKNLSQVVLYESPECASQDVHTLKIVSKNKSPVSIYQIVYQVLPSTEEFSLSADFSKSDSFTKTGVFSLSNDFTKSGVFSRTDDFSQSNKFHPSSFFTHSDAFSMSSAFSPSLEIPPFEGDFCMVESPEENFTANHCNFEQDQAKNMIVHVIRTNFTNFIEEDRCGGAIRIINYAFECTSVLFSNCITKSCGGGAIYIKNYLDLDYNVTIDNITVKECQALYGGGVYIYFGSEENEVRITRSIFSHNIATLTSKTDEHKDLFGGDHIFLTVKHLFVKDSTFEKGRGKSGVKIYNEFDKQGNRELKLDTSENYIMFSGCNFELDERSESSINYIDTKNTNKIDLVGCNFAGKVGKERHYVDGSVGSKENDNIRIISCKFEYENELAVNIDTFKEDKFIKTNELIEKSGFFGSISFIFLAISILVAMIIITLIFIVLKLAKRNNEVY